MEENKSILLVFWGAYMSKSRDNAFLSAPPESKQFKADNRSTGFSLSQTHVT